MVAKPRDEKILMSSQVKEQRRILEQRKKFETGVQNWIEANTHKPMPKWAQGIFEKAKYRMVLHSNRFTTNGFTWSSLKLPFWYSVINLLLWVFRVEIRFSTEPGGQIINVGVFYKGKYFDSYIKPEEVINGSKKTKAT